MVGHKDFQRVVRIGQAILVPIQLLVRLAFRISRIHLIQPEYLSRLVIIIFFDGQIVQGIYLLLHRHALAEKVRIFLIQHTIRHNEQSKA